MDEVIGEHGIPVLIPPDSSRRTGRTARLDRRPLHLHAPRARDATSGKRSTENANR